MIWFRAERVELAKDFLGDEFKCATDRLVSAQMMRELGEMTLQTRQFFGNIGAVGEKGNLFEQTFVVIGNRQTCLLNALDERRTVPFDYIGMERANLLEFFSHRFEPVN